MKKVNLDLEFEKFKKQNLKILQEKFNEIHNFNNYFEEKWQEYQEENELIDKSNELNITQCAEIYEYLKENKIK